MSFIKIKDPRKREELIKDLIETRKRIKDNFIARKVGESEYQTGLIKLFKPITETQKATAKEITDAQKATVEKFRGELLPIKESLENLTIIPPIEAGEEKKAIALTESLTEEEKTNLGPTAETFLKTPWNKENLDLNFGLNTQNEKRKYKIGDKFVDFDGDDIVVEGERFKGTSGFWALIISKNPSPDNYTNEDKKQYKRLLIKSNAIFKDNNPEETRAKGNYQGNNGKKLLILFGKKLNPNQQEREEKVEREKENDKKTPNLLQVEPV